MARLDALGDRELRRTLLFVRGQAAAVTAAEAARALGVARTAARWRLEKLAATGLLVARFERRSGRTGPGGGRPAKTYAPAAETSQLEFPRRRYERLVALLIGALPRRGRKGELRGIGASFGRELGEAAGMRRARRRRTALERVCDALGELGFHASLRSCTADEAVIESATCPLRPLVIANSDARMIDEGMWCGLVEAAVDRVAVAGVECRTHACLDRESACRIVVTFGAQT